MAYNPYLLQNNIRIYMEHIHLLFHLLQNQIHIEYIHLILQRILHQFHNLNIILLFLHLNKFLLDKENIHYDMNLLHFHLDKLCILYFQ